MTESHFQALLVASLKKFNAEVLHVHGGSVYQAPGWPDLYIAHPKWSGWLELKVGSNKLQDIQRFTIMRLLRCGVPVQVWRLDGNVENLVTQATMPFERVLDGPIGALQILSPEVVLTPEELKRRLS